MNNTADPSHLERIFNRSDRLFHLVAIPVFSLLTSLLMKDGQEEHLSLFWTLVEPMIWVLFIWLLNRFMILKIRKRFPDQKKLYPRLFYQLGLALLIGFLAAGGSIVFHATIVEPEKTFFECFIWTKRLILTILVYSLLENLVYEAFYLFTSLTKSVVEAEEYKKESLEARFQNLKNQLNPHFLFNSFSTLNTVIEEDPKRAIIFVEELSKLYRYVLNSQKTDWVLVQDEMEMVKSYVFLQQQRHEENLKVIWEVAPEYANWWLPPLAMQVTIENAIKHNEVSSERPLTIRIYQEGPQIFVENPLQEKKKLGDSNGIGLSNLKSRYQFLSGLEVVIEKGQNQFKVGLPLLQMVDK